jgi:endo-1,4-beta-xylanase
MNPLLRSFRLHPLCLALMGAAFAAPATATLPAPLPAELIAAAPVNVLPPDPPRHYRFHDRSTTGTPATVAAVDIPAMGTVLRGTNPNRDQKHFQAEISWGSAVSIQEGDVLLARFSARALTARQESGEGAVEFYVQEAREPHARSIQLGFAPSADWAVFEIPFTAGRDYAPGEATVAFSFGHLAQAFELAGVELLNFQNRIPLAQLPRTRFTYAGRSADAAWRAEALERIERLRTATLEVRVVGADGGPIAGASIQADLVRPAFLFGSAVHSGMIAQDTPEAERYRQTILELFDSVTIENGLKWRGWVGESARPDETRAALDWIVTHRLRLRGHTLVWPGWKFTPAIIRNRTDLSESLADLINDHIREMMALTRGRVYGWDVLNELVHERDYLQHLPEETAAEWFKLARQLDPEAELYINDYNMLNSARSPSVIARYREIIGRLRRAGAPIDGIGVQGHLGKQVRSPERVLADLDLLAAEGLPIHITEFDINSDDEELQADYTRDFLIACYSHPAVTGFILWGFWEATHWRPAAAMIRQDWTPKPNLAVWQEWVLEKWRTRIDSVTDANGSFTTRGHLGSYHVTVTQDGMIHRTSVTLDAPGASIVVKLPLP